MHKSTSFIIFIALSILAVIFIREVHVILHWIDVAHQWIMQGLSKIIAGRIIRQSLGLILAPLLIALIPAFIYWLFRRSFMPYYMAVVWVIWVLLLTIMAYA